MNIYLDIYLEKNLGDDLFLETILRRYPDHTFYIITQLDYSNFSDRYSNLKIIKYNRYLNYLVVKTGNKINRLKRLVKNNHIDGMISIGGSIFIQSPIWETMYQERLDTWSYFKEKGLPIYIIGSNFGPFQSSEFKMKYEKAFELVEDVCFRDQYSYQLFSQFKNIRLAADPVLTLDTKKSNNILPNSIGISIIDLSYRPSLKKYQDIYLDQMVDLLDEWTQEGKNIYLMSFCQSEGDEKQIELILSRVKDQDRIATLLYDGEIDPFINNFSQMENIFATRFHSIILALILEIPTFVLNYSEKSEHLIRDNQIEFQSLNINQLDTIKLNNDNVRFNPSSKINEMQQSAEGQFAQVDLWLDK